MPAAELNRRIWFTLAALLVYRLGTYVPLPGIDPVVWQRLFRSHGLFDVYTGSATSRLAIFALGILPYISAAVFIQILIILSSRLRALRQRGERGRSVIDGYTYGLTALLTAFQAYGIASGLEGISDVVVEPGWLFRASTVATLTAGTMFLVWLSQQITARGIGNGIALILFADVVIDLVAAIPGTLVRLRQGLMSIDLLVVVLAIGVAMTVVIVVMERARRVLWVRYDTPIGSAAVADRRSPLRLKVNGAGLIPSAIAVWPLGIPGIIAVFVGGPDATWWTNLDNQLVSGKVAFIAIYIVLVVIGTFLYAAWVLDPDEAAADLARYGGRIDGIEPGEPTAAHLDHVLSRTTAIGAAYLALVCLIPEILIAAAKVPFYFGGTSLLIVACTVMDIQAQVMAKRS
jgi:preprotein translocase subunit SecY